LYQQYGEATGRQPARSSAVARINPMPTGAEAEAMKRADTLVHKDATLTLADALACVFHDDPALYQRYCEGEADDTPTTPA
jgi:hypothetical protein